MAVFIALRRRYFLDDIREMTDWRV